MIAKVNVGFIEAIMSKRLHAVVKVLRLESYDIDNSSSILTTLNQSQEGLSVGHYGYTVVYQVNGIMKKKNMVLKMKTYGNKTSEMLSGLSSHLESGLSKVYPEYAHLMGFHYSHYKELEVYEKCSHDILPEIFGIYRNENIGVFMILMEDLTPYRHLNTVMNPETWTLDELKVCLTDLASWHKYAHSLVDDFKTTEWKHDIPETGYFNAIMPVLTELLENIKGLELVSSSQYQLLEKQLKELPDHAKWLDGFPKTVIHNDCNLRNSCLRPSNTDVSLLLYDWELATIQVPHYDLAEFICFVITNDTKFLIPQIVDAYYVSLIQDNIFYQEKKDFIKVLQRCASQFAIHRLGLYAMAHRLTPYPFLARVYKGYFLLHEYCDSYLSN